MSDFIDKNTILNSCEKLLDTSVHLKIILNQSEIEEIIQNEGLRSKIKEFNSFKQWKDNELNPQLFDDFAIDWIFLCDLLNFSFWQDENSENFNVEFNGKVYKNYWSLPATLNMHSSLLVDPNFYSQITLNQFDQIFNPNIPLKTERINIMNEAGRILVDKYDGSFSNFLAIFESKKVWDFINHLLTEFPCFRDYNAKSSTWFLKRAQILVADLWAASEGKYFNDSIDQLTIFADYRIPQVLSSMGLIRYSQNLKDKLSRKELISSEEECEIRAASIIVCEKLRYLLGCDNSVELDFCLWEYSQKQKDEIDSIYPFHRFRSIYY